MGSYTTRYNRRHKEFGHLFSRRYKALIVGGAATEGLLHEAHEGTLFIDEFHALTPPCQIKLLRFLDSGQIRRIGSRKVSHADVRVLAATNIELEQSGARGANSGRLSSTAE